MNRTASALLALLAFLIALPAAAQGAPPPVAPPAQPPAQPLVEEVPPRPAWKSKLFYGGSLGASFGDIDLVELAPILGYQINPRVSVGSRLFYRWTSDDRYTPSQDTTDYGGSLFSRITIVPSLFGQVEWEYLNYEYLTSTNSSFRDSTSSVLVGAGFFQPAGRNAGFFISALYNVTYDDNDPYYPYDSPWIYRVGFTVGF